MIYTDGTHIISDAGLQELHWFTERVAIARFYFNQERALYDRPAHISTNRIIEHGAKYVTARHMQQIIKQKK